MIALAILLLLLIAAVKYLIAEIPSIAGDGGYEFPVPRTIQSGILMRSAAKHLVGTMKVLLVAWQITTQVRWSAMCGGGEGSKAFLKQLSSASRERA